MLALRLNTHAPRSARLQPSDRSGRPFSRSHNRVTFTHAEDEMRTFLICMAWLSATMSAAGIAQSSSGTAAGATASMAVLLDNARVHVVRVYQTPSASVGVASRGPAVIVPLDDGASRKMGQ